MGARPYDPNLGRFLAVDPVNGGSLNNYDYAGQDPVNGYDLSGQMLDDQQVVAQAGVGQVTLQTNLGEGRTVKDTITDTENGSGQDIVTVQVTTKVDGQTTRTTGFQVVETPAPANPLPWWMKVINASCTVTNGPTPINKKQFFNPSFVSQLISDVWSTLACPEPAR